LDIRDIYVHFFIISPLSFCAENNLDQWYQSKLLLIVFQCMFPMSSEYINLGLDLVYLEYNRSRMPKKPSMVEENKSKGEITSINMLLEQALT
jgi:hypothetical protein